MDWIYLFWFISCVFAFFVILEAKKRIGFFFNHYLCYNLAWLGLIFLSLSFNTYINEVDPLVYVIFLSSLFFFNITIFFYVGQKIKKVDIVTLDLKKRRYVEIFVVFCLIPAAITNYKLIQSGVELWELNNMYWHESRASGSYLYQQFQQLLLEPLATLLISSMLYSKYKGSTKFSYLITILIGSVIALEYMLITGGGRGPVMMVFFTLVMAYCAKYNPLEKNCIKAPNLKYLIICAIGICSVLAFANNGRAIGNNFFQDAIDGYTVFAPLFEYYLYSDVFSNNTYGASMFEGIVVFLQLPFKLFDYVPYDQTNNDILQQGVYVAALGEDKNTQVSACFQYMRDFGYIGIAIGPIITAWIYNLCLKIAKRNTFYMILYYCVVLRLCLSTLTYPFNKSFIFVAIYAYCFYHWTRVSTNKIQKNK
jgi:oligosaccharide repeat unit polymerase